MRGIVFVYLVFNWGNIAKNVFSKVRWSYRGRGEGCSNILSILDTMVLHKGCYQNCLDSMLWLIKAFPINLNNINLNLFSSHSGIYMFWGKFDRYLRWRPGELRYSSRRREQQKKRLWLRLVSIPVWVFAERFVQNLSLSFMTQI